MRLAIDTVTDQLSVALGSSIRDALTTTVAGARRHATALLPAIDGLLARAGKHKDDIREVVLADGPGSFTGLRVGAAVAKALAAAGRVELYAAPSLLARAWHSARPGEVVIAVADALRGELYAGAWLRVDDQVEALVPLQAWRPHQLRALVPQPDVLTGDIPSALRVELQGWARRTEPGVPAEASWLLGLARSPGALVRIVDPNGWEPEYGRPAEAQARWEAEHRRPLPHSAGTAG